MQTGPAVLGDLKDGFHLAKVVIFKAVVRSPEVDGAALDLLDSAA